MIDFSVTNQTFLDEFRVVFTQHEFHIIHETLRKFASCNATSNVAIKFEQIDTTASLVLKAHNDSSIFSKPVKVSEQFFNL